MVQHEALSKAMLLNGWSEPLTEKVHIFSSSKSSLRYYSLITLGYKTYIKCYEGTNARLDSLVGKDAQEMEENRIYFGSGFCHINYAYALAQLEAELISSRKCGTFGNALPVPAKVFRTSLIRTCGSQQR